jgi:hypothetical protein
MCDVSMIERHRHNVAHPGSHSLVQRCGPVTGLDSISGEIVGNRSIDRLSIPQTMKDN